MRKLEVPINLGILLSLAIGSTAAAHAAAIPAPTVYPPAGTYQSRMQVSLFEGTTNENVEVYYTDEAGNFWLFGGGDFGGSGNELYKYQAP